MRVKILCESYFGALRTKKLLRLGFSEHSCKSHSLNSILYGKSTNQSGNNHKSHTNRNAGKGSLLPVVFWPPRSLIRMGVHLEHFLSRDEEPHSLYWAYYFLWEDPSLVSSWVNALLFCLSVCILWHLTNPSTMWHEGRGCMQAGRPMLAVERDLLATGGLIATIKANFLLSLL